LQEARDLFTSQGFASSGVREICQEAWVTATVLYYHFGIKTGLFESAVVEALKLEGLCDLLREEVAALSDRGAKLRACGIDRQRHEVVVPCGKQTVSSGQRARQVRVCLSRNKNSKPALGVGQIGGTHLHRLGGHRQACPRDDQRQQPVRLCPLVVFILQDSVWVRI
jgi:AcrR family transcriptional regulator